MQLYFNKYIFNEYIFKDIGERGRGEGGKGEGHIPSYIFNEYISTQSNIEIWKFVIYPSSKNIIGWNYNEHILTYFSEYSTKKLYDPQNDPSCHFKPEGY